MLKALTLINTTPHDVTVLVHEKEGADSQKMVFPVNPARSIRLRTIAGEKIENVTFTSSYVNGEGHTCSHTAPLSAYERPRYEVDSKQLAAAFPDGLPEDCGLIVSTLVAETKEGIEAHFGHPVRLFVPDSGPDSIRVNGAIYAVRRIFKY